MCATESGDGNGPAPQPGPFVDGHRGCQRHRLDVPETIGRGCANLHGVSSLSLLGMTIGLRIQQRQPPQHAPLSAADAIQPCLSASDPGEVSGPARRRCRR